MFAYGGTWNGFHWWWLLPVAMMIFCFIMMRARVGCRPGGSKSRPAAESPSLIPSASAREILDKRYALGEIGKAEYEEKKRDISQ